MIQLRIRYIIGCLLFAAFTAIFYPGISAAFCEYESAPIEPFSPLTTLDHSDYGIIVKLVDFSDSIVQNEFLMDFSGTHSNSSLTGLLSVFLGADGYPTNRDGVSMATLFDNAVEINHLFPAGKPGILEFDSTQCFASQHGDRFVVYRELGTADFGNSTTHDHGQFLPFNDLTPGWFSSVHPTNERDALGQALPDDDPRKGERLYAITEDEINYYFGAEITIPFRYLEQTEEELVAFFTGDDDLWVYIDGALVLDLGGIHSAVPGTIYFSTGKVTFRGSDGKDYTTSLYNIFQKDYESANQNAGIREIKAYLETVFCENNRWQQVFPDNSVHTMRIFYMERGASAANLHIMMNMPLIRKDE